MRAWLLVCFIGCRSAASTAPSSPPGPAARALGITEYAVMRDEPAALEVDLHGPSPGHLSVRTTREATSETYTTADAHFTLSVMQDALRLDSDRLAVHDANGWTALQALTTEQREKLELAAAVDEDMAVQGTTIVHGSEYVACTLECERGIDCLPRSRSLGGECAEALATCMLCLEVAP